MRLLRRRGNEGAITIATNLAGRGVDIKLGGATAEESRLHAQDIKSLGGLFVLGTERHESRRIDDQLRGRCGRQGDEGETQFYLSLEDDLTRVFGSDQVRGVAQRLGLPEDQGIQNNIISKSIESAQKRVEGHHFDARRFSLEYDTILDEHRAEVYERRRKMLFAENVDVLKEFVDEKIIEKAEEKEPEKYFEILRSAVLRGIDIAWMEHLELMDYARSSAGLRSYGQREPLAEYRKETQGADCFGGFWAYVKEKVASSVGVE